jgi:hypothetical protein
MLEKLVSLTRKLQEIQAHEILLQKSEALEKKNIAFDSLV